MELNREKWDQVVLVMKNTELKLELLSQSEKEDVSDLEFKMDDHIQKFNTILCDICSKLQQLSIGKGIDGAILRKLQGDLSILKA